MARNYPITIGSFLRPTPRCPSDPRPNVLVMRVMFFGYLFVVIFGLVFAIVTGFVSA